MEHKVQFVNNNKKIENEKNYLSYLSRKSQQLVSLNIDLDHWNSTRTGVGLDPSSVVSLIASTTMTPLGPR